MDPISIAKATLLAPFALEEEDLSRTLGSMLTHDVDHADLYFQYSRSEGWSLEEGAVKSGSFHIEQGVGIRAISGEKTAFAYSDDIHAEALQQAARATRAIGRSGQEATFPLLRAKPHPAALLYTPQDPLSTLPDEAKVRLLERLEGMARRIDPRVVQVMASLAGEYEVVLVARSDGGFQADVRPLVRVSLQVIAEQGGLREQGSAGGGGRCGYEYFSDAILEGYAHQAVQQALLNLEARPAPPGTPARPARCQSTVTAKFPGITVHYSCFAGESRFFFPGLSHVGFFLSPAEETVSLNRAAKSFGCGNGEMYIFFSSAPGCHYGAGVTLKLNDPCLLILSQAGFADSLPFAFLHSHGYSTVQGYVSRCGFKGGQPVFGMVQCAPGHPPANRTAGSITFTRFAFPPRLPPGADRWAAQHIGHFAFRFSAGAPVTGFYVNQSLATVTVAVPLAGAASGIID